MSRRSVTDRDADGSAGAQCSMFNIHLNGFPEN